LKIEKVFDHRVFAKVTEALVSVELCASLRENSLRSLREIKIPEPN